jgi:hypothetical protein
VADVADELTRPSSELTRGDLLKKGTAAAFAISMFGGLTDRALGFYGPLKYANRQLSGQLRIMQWAHFVPAYDQWLDNTYVKRWGEANDVEVKVDHINNAGRRTERSRPVLVHLSAFDVPEASRSRHRPRARGQQEARADVEGCEEEHLQPEDEAVLRIP